MSPAERFVDSGEGGIVRRVGLFIRRVPDVGLRTNKQREGVGWNGAGVRHHCAWLMIAVIKRSDNTADNSCLCRRTLHALSRPGTQNFDKSCEQWVR